MYGLRGAVENVSFPSLSILSVYEWNRPSSLLPCWNVIFWQSDWLSVGFWTHFLSFFASGRQMMEFVHESMCVHPYILFLPLTSACSSAQIWKAVVTWLNDSSVSCVCLLWKCTDIINTIDSYDCIVYNDNMNLLRHTLNLFDREWL